MIVGIFIVFSASAACHFSCECVSKRESPKRLDSNYSLFQTSLHGVATKGIVTHTHTHIHVREQDTSRHTDSGSVGVRLPLAATTGSVAVATKFVDLQPAKVDSRGKARGRGRDSEQGKGSPVAAAAVLVSVVGRNRCCCCCIVIGERAVEPSMSLTEFQHLARRNEKQRGGERGRDSDDMNDRQVVTPALIVPHSTHENI